MTFSRPRYKFPPGCAGEPSLRRSSSIGPSRWIFEIELSFRQIEGFQQVRRFEQLTGLMRRRQFRLPMRRPPLPWIQRPIVPIYACVIDKPTRRRNGSSRKTTRQLMGMQCDE